MGIEVWKKRKSNINFTNSIMKVAFLSSTMFNLIVGSLISSSSFIILLQSAVPINKLSLIIHDKNRNPEEARFNIRRSQRNNED